jgi:hypothetical protein
MYKPAPRDSLRLWLTRMLRTCQSSPRLAATALLVTCFLTWMLWGRTGEIVYVHPPVILVAVLNHTDSAGEEVKILDKILENRWEYADAHGMTPHAS